MKKLTLLFLLTTMCVLSQDYERVDATIQLYPNRVDTAEELSRFISRDFATEGEQVRAIYSWLIYNVSYDPAEYKKFDYSFKNYRERNQKEEKTRAKIIERTLQTGKAVCEGYAFVFEKLCELQGIENYLVRGDTKTHFKDIGREFRKNHMWNVAKIDGAWYLFDATWGAGKYQKTFVREPSYFYFMTPPEQFIKSHYPEMIEDTFLREPIPREAFCNAPLIISETVTMDQIKRPKSGLLFSMDERGFIPFRIVAKAPSQITYSYGDVEESIVFSESNGILEFEVPLELGKTQLLVYFDGQPVLGYKLK